MKKVLVTGATGFVGCHLVKKLVEQGIDVYAVCSVNSMNKNRLAEYKTVNIISCDIENIGKLPDIISERGFDTIYHLAWKGASGELRTNCNIQIDNIKWTSQLAEVACRLECKKIVVTGTVCENQCDAIIHKEIFSKSSYYLLAKKASYELLRMNCIQQNIELVWCTFYHPIGKYNKQEQLIANTIWKLITGKTPQFGSATQLFDVIAVEDLAQGLYLAGEKELHKDRYFIGSGEPRSLAEYLKKVRDIVNPNVELQFGKYPDDGLPMKKEWLDVKEFSAETGYEPRISFEEGVISTWNWIRAQ